VLKSINPPPVLWLVVIWAGDVVCLFFAWWRGVFGFDVSRASSMFAALALGFWALLGWLGIGAQLSEWGPTAHRE
jgi:hypothetical protein